MGSMKTVATRDEDAAHGGSGAGAGAAVRGPASAQTVLVKMATLVPDGSSWHLILKETADKWRTALQRHASPSASTRGAWPATIPTWSARCGWARSTRAC